MTILNIDDKFTIENIKNYTASQKYPNKIIDFLKNNGEMTSVIFGGFNDPLTGEQAGEECVCKELDNFEWHDLDIYMIEKYNLALNPYFLEFVKDKI